MLLLRRRNNLGGLEIGDSKSQHMLHLQIRVKKQMFSANKLLRRLPAIATCSGFQNGTEIINKMARLI